MPNNNHVKSTENGNELVELLSFLLGTPVDVKIIKEELPTQHLCRKHTTKTDCKSNQCANHNATHKYENNCAYESNRYANHNATNKHENNCPCKNEKIDNSPIKKVLFNQTATIIFWKDGTKTVAKCDEHDKFNPWAGMALAMCKKFLGKKEFYNIFERYLPADAVATATDKKAKHSKKTITNDNI